MWRRISPGGSVSWGRRSAYSQDNSFNGSGRRIPIGIRMCLGIPARVLSVRDGRATLDLRGRRIEADASMVPVSPGDYVLSYAGLIVQVLSAQEAEETLRLLAQVEKESVTVP